MNAYFISRLDNNLFGFDGNNKKNFTLFVKLKEITKWL